MDCRTRMTYNKFSTCLSSYYEKASRYFLSLHEILFWREKTFSVVNNATIVCSYVCSILYIDFFSGIKSAQHVCISIYANKKEIYSHGWIKTQWGIEYDNIHKDFSTSKNVNASKYFICCFDFTCTAFLILNISTKRTDVYETITSLI